MENAVKDLRGFNYLVGEIDKPYHRAALKPGLPPYGRVKADRELGSAKAWTDGIVKLEAVDGSMIISQVYKPAVFSAGGGKTA